MKNLVFLAFLSLLATPAGAVTLQHGEITVPEATQSACFDVAGRLNDGVTAGILTVQKVGADAPEQVVWVKQDKDPQDFSRLFCLKSGFGEYELKVTVSLKPKVSDGGAGSYYLEKPETLRIRNLDSNRFDQTLYPSPDIQSSAPEIQMTAEAITEGALSIRTKIGLIHDWVAQNIAYDTEGYFAWIDGNQAKSFQNKKLDALSVFKSHVSVCQGYANLTVALLRAQGIPARVVTGVASSEPIEWTPEKLDPNSSYQHAWVEYNYLGKWLAMDPTWDSGGVDFETRKFSPDSSRKYFENEEFFEKTHKKVGAQREY